MSNPNEKIKTLEPQPQQNVGNSGGESGAGHSPAVGPALEALRQFFSALFQPEEFVLLRPIETWTQDNRKRSRVIYKQMRHCRPTDLLRPATWDDLLKMAAAERANLFFGVCPRAGGRGNYDLIWQIRTVRALWADLDNCTVEESRERCERANLPRPSYTPWPRGGRSSTVCSATRGRRASAPAWATP